MEMLKDLRPLFAVLAAGIVAILLSMTFSDRGPSSVHIPPVSTTSVTVVSTGDIVDTLDCAERDAWEGNRLSDCLGQVVLP